MNVQVFQKCPSVDLHVGEFAMINIEINLGIKMRHVVQRYLSLGKLHRITDIVYASSAY